jgi:hypothetical protein
VPCIGAENSVGYGVALWYRVSGWLEGLRLVWGRFKDKGAVDGMSPFPVADSPETTPPGLGSKILKEAKEVMTEEESL